MPSQKPRLRMLDTTGGLRMLDQLNPRGLRMIDSLKANPKPKAKRTGRDADPRRLLPLTGAAWQKLRAQVLAEEPLCRDCLEQGRTEPSTDCDHIDGNPGNNERSNLAGRCHACHSIKTAADHGKATKQPIGLDGMPKSWRDTP